MKWVKKHGLHEVLEAIDASFERYYDERLEEKERHESWTKAFNYIPRVIAFKQRVAEKPHLKDLFYIRGILRNRLHYINLPVAMQLLERAYLSGATIENLREFAKTVRNWTSFQSEINDFLLAHEGDGEDTKRPS